MGRPKRRSNLPPFHRALAKYLGQHGWVVVVTGASRVVARGPNKFNYTFEMDFTGIKRTPHPTRQGR